MKHILLVAVVVGTLATIASAVIPRQKPACAAITVNNGITFCVTKTGATPL